MTRRRELKYHPPKKSSRRFQKSPEKLHGKIIETLFLCSARIHRKAININIQSGIEITHIQKYHDAAPLLKLCSSTSDETFIYFEHLCVAVSLSSTTSTHVFSTAALCSEESLVCYQTIEPKRTSNAEADLYRPAFGIFTDEEEF